ncbi:hypothetical protein C8R46DRAFT_1191760 [Mycena filopes]|nr:hypothetical protein C8R46DRAFT_1191760 [Mycena filopes]
MPTAELRRRLVELDTEIIKQEAVLDALKSDRLAAQQELDDTSTFPILSLPVEITTEIFIWCLPTIDELREDYVSRSDGEPAERHAPLTLASCCRLWRTIALGTPSLWTTLPVFFRDDSISKPSREDLPESIDLWLGRAAAIRPLTFVFHIPPPPLYYGPHYIRTFLHCVRDALHRYAQRLEHLDLTAKVSDLSFLLNSDSIDFPLLQRIVIGRDGNRHTQYHHDDEETFTAPQFSELLLLDSARLSSYSLPLTRLTRFEGGLDNLRLFQLAPDLLEVKCCFHLAEWTLPQAAITHSSLQSLTLSFPDPVDLEYAPHILDKLTLPALLSLDFPDDTPTDVDVLHSLLQRSNPPLKSLAVHVGVVTWDDNEEDAFYLYDECFSAVAATLENLDISSPIPAFMTSLWHQGSNNCFLPHLKSPTLIKCPPVNYKVVLTFLHRRSRLAVAKLEYFQLQYADGIVLDHNRFTIPESDGTPRTVKGHLRELESNGTLIQIGSSRQHLF